MEYLDLADFFVIAGAALGVDSETLIDSANVGLAESALAAPAAEFGGVEFYPDFHVKVAVLGWHLIRNHPLLDGNKRAGFVAMIEFAQRNGYEWIGPERDEKTQGDETVKVVEGVANGTRSVDQLPSWVQERLHKSSSE